MEAYRSVLIRRASGACSFSRAIYAFLSHLGPCTFTRCACRATWWSWATPHSMQTKWPALIRRKRSSMAFWAACRPLTASRVSLRRARASISSREILSCSACRAERRRRETDHLPVWARGSPELEGEGRSLKRTASISLNCCASVGSFSGRSVGAGASLYIASDVIGGGGGRQARRRDAGV